MSCSNDMKDCMKPLLLSLFYGRQKVMKNAASMIWTGNSRPTTFSQFWAWLWAHNGDHIYGVLVALDALLKCVAK